jgi:hypothetical protein
MLAAMRRASSRVSNWVNPVSPPCGLTHCAGAMLCPGVLGPWLLFGQAIEHRRTMSAPMFLEVEKELQ